MRKTHSDIPGWGYVGWGCVESEPATQVHAVDQELNLQYFGVWADVLTIENTSPRARLLEFNDDKHKKRL